MHEIETFQKFQSITLASKYPRDNSFFSISYFAHRAISTRISWSIYRHAKKITPNLVTSAAIILTLIGTLILIIGDRNGAILGIAAGVLYLSFLADKVDGEIARARGLTSRVKPHLDDMYHALQPLNILGLSVFLSGLDIRLVFAGFSGSYFLFVSRYKDVLRRQKEWVQELNDESNNGSRYNESNDMKNPNSSQRSLVSSIIYFGLRFDTFIVGLAIGCLLPGTGRDVYLLFFLLFISIAITFLMSKALLYDIWHSVKG